MPARLTWRIVYENMFRLPAILLLVTCVLPLSAQEEEFHEFTDKKGQQILAMLLDVSPDKKLMKIRRKDGQEFETEILVLSLDDQQYIKNWMQTRTVKTDYRLELDVTKKPVKTERHDRNSSSYTYEQRFWNFEINVRNLSRETLPSTKLEYVVLWDDQLTIYQANDGDWTYTYPSDEIEAYVKMSGESALAAIPFNREELVTTDSFEINRMVYSGDVYREDEPLGIIARVVSEAGEVLAETRSGTSVIDSMSWEEAIELPVPTTRD